MNMESTSMEDCTALDLLKHELHDFTSEQNKLKHEISNLCQENQKLLSELRRDSEIRFQQLSASNVELLQRQIQAEASKNSAVEMWPAALKELEKNDELLHEEKNIVAAEDRKEHMKQLSDANNQYEEKLVSLETLLASSNNALASCREQLSHFKNENTRLSVSVAEMKDINKKLKSQILMLEKDSREALFIAQEAIWLKKEAILKEKNSLKEIQVLKSSIDLEIEKVSMRYKSEMKETQKKAEEKTKGLMDEIELLHSKIGEKQSMFDRASREKQSLESRLEKIVSENSTSLSVTSFAFEDLCKRLTVAERARDEYELKATSLETALKKLTSLRD